MDFYCIADEDTVRGFRLAGVEGCVVTSATEARVALHQAAALGASGILIVTQPIASWMRTEVESFRLEHDRPLLVEIPGPEGPLATGKTLRQLVRSAVGIHLDQEKVS